jgi:hypothetical protein
MQHQIEFTADSIRDVWRLLFNAEPGNLTTKQVYDACLMELGPEILRQALRERNDA